MAAKVLHFGTDTCNRLLVLRSVGYSVDACLSLTEFHTILESSDPDAVLVASRPSLERRQVITFTREHSRAGLVLFDSSYYGSEEGEFDLVIGPQVTPEEWLRQIALLIEQSRVLKARSRTVRERSSQLIKASEVARQASEIARRKSVAQRERAAKERAKAGKILDNIRPKPD